MSVGHGHTVVSQKKFARYEAHGFWVYDVALGVFLKHLIDAAEATDQAGTLWLSTAISSWREVACVPDYGLRFAADWSAAQKQTFIALVEDASARLARRASIPAEEIVSWQLLDDLRICPRGATEVHSGPVVELGRAIIALVSEELPEAPGGETWLYGTPTGRQTIGKHNF
jgi:hypothetical protein